MPTPGSGTNEIVPFATGVGANVQTAAEHEANIARQQGYQRGVLPSQWLNTTLRQASEVAAMIAQFTADYSGQTFADDGDVLGMEANFIAALLAHLQPYGVYFIPDTGTGNHVVGTSTPAPENYSDVRLLVFKKSNTDNTGSMDIDLWSKGVVTLKDNTGADFGNAAIKANSFYIATWDGSGFRILGGAATYTNVTNLTAASGDGIEVTIGGLVNRRRARGVHDIVVAAGDRWARGKAADDTDLHMTTAELITYLNGALSFVTAIPPFGTGQSVGQEICVCIHLYGSYTAPATANINPGDTVSGADLSAGRIPTANVYLIGVFGPNGSNTGTAAVWPGGAAKVSPVNVLPGTWTLIQHKPTAGVVGITAYDCTFKRTA